jgi:hypothetical protein
MVDGIHMLIWGRTKKPLVIALSGVGRGLRWREDGGDLMYNISLIGIVTMNPSLIYNEYILIKFFIKKFLQYIIVEFTPSIILL